jgi:type I restriction-modification system DNA methylase subunit
MDPKERAYNAVEALVAKYRRLSPSRLKAYNEDNTRKDFILPLFRALCWDVDDASEVAAEEKVSRGWVDFSFRVGGFPRFFLETKRVAEDLTKPKWVAQAIDYAWTKGVSWALLSDFQGLLVFNAEWKEENPIRAKFLEFTVDSYLSQFDQLWWLSRPEIVAGTLEHEAEKVGRRIRRQPVTTHLFDDLRLWRSELFRHLARYNKRRSPSQIDEAVLRILNRLIFIRTAEDREVEQLTLLPLLRELEDRNHLGRLPQELATVFRRLDAVYDSDIFAEHFSEQLDCEPEPFRLLIEGLYENKQDFIRYNFNAIDADVLGAAYEQYLGATIADPLALSLKEKRAKRKAQGIYYTPSFVVRFITRATLSRHLAEAGYVPGQHPTVLDMSCGSGSFLIEALDAIDRHVANMRVQTTGSREDFHDLARRIEILGNCIYGVDRDEQAVAVTKLNLSLKALHERGPLPMLNNIRCGDSLISGAPTQLQEVFGSDWPACKSFDWAAEFPSALNHGGFDAIVGNPPYFNIETLGKGSPEAAWIRSAFPEVWMDKSDILFYFIARAIQLLRGRMGFIVSRAFLEADKAQKLRQFILDTCAVETVIDFRDFRVFQDANIATAIVILRKEPSSEARSASTVRVAQVFVTEAHGPSLTQQIEVLLADHETHTTPAFSVFNFPQSRLSSAPWAFAPPKDDALFARIDAQHPRLANLCHVGEGMQTGANEVFEVDAATVRRASLERRYLRMRAPNSDIQPYIIDHSGSFLVWVEDIPAFKDLPPNVASYLKSHSSHLKQRAAYLRGNCQWWKFTWPLHKELYSRPKIICPYRAPENRFALDASADFIGLTDTTVIFLHDGDPHDIRYYLGLLNSRVLTHRFRGLGKMTGAGMYEYFKNSVGRIPIRVIDFSSPNDRALHDAIVARVDSVIALRSQLLREERELSDQRYSTARRIQALQAETDAIVCQLYSLAARDRRAIGIS